jgi:hypothetical protein
MTPDDARQRWCPFGRTVSSRIPASFNRAVRDDVEQPPVLNACTRCVAYACMMWVGDENQGDCGLKHG